MEKTHACSQGFILKDCTVLRIGFTHGNRLIIHKKQCKEIRAWRAERKAREKPRLHVSICENCTKRWLVVRAKALYNSYVFPPCMIIQQCGVFSRGFSQSIFMCIVPLILLLWVILFSSIFKLPQIDNRSRL